MSDSTENHDSSLVSRSQKKRDAQAVFQLAHALVELSPNRLKQLSLTQDILELIRRVKGIKSQIARKRELQFLAKHLRKIDADSIADRLEDMTGHQHQLSQNTHRIESWRDRLIDEGVPAVNRLMATHPHIERPALLNLIKLAKTQEGDAPQQLEAAQQAKRKLFLMLKSIEESAPLPDHSPSN